MTTYFISVLDQKSHELIHENVSHNIYVYIGQLEAYIQNPKVSGLLRTYPRLARQTVSEPIRGIDFNNLWCADDTIGDESDKDL